MGPKRAAAKEKKSRKEKKAAKDARREKYRRISESPPAETDPWKDVAPELMSRYPYCYRKADVGNKNLGANEPILDFFFKDPSRYDKDIVSDCLGEILRNGDSAWDDRFADMNDVKDELVGPILAHVKENCDYGLGAMDRSCSLCTVKETIKSHGPNRCSDLVRIGKWCVECRKEVKSKDYVKIDDPVTPYVPRSHVKPGQNIMATPAASEPNELKGQRLHGYQNDNDERQRLRLMDDDHSEAEVARQSEEEREARKAANAKTMKRKSIEAAPQIAEEHEESPAAKKRQTKKGQAAEEPNNLQPPTAPSCVRTSCVEGLEAEDLRNEPQPVTGVTDTSDGPMTTAPVDDEDLPQRQDSPVQMPEVQPEKSSRKKKPTVTGLSKERIPAFKKSETKVKAHEYDVSRLGTKKDTLVGIFRMPDGTFSIQTGGIYKDSERVTLVQYHTALTTAKTWTRAMHPENEQTQYWYDWWEAILRYQKGEPLPGWEEWEPQISAGDTEEEKEKLLGYIDQYARNAEALVKMGIITKDNYGKNERIMTHDFYMMPQEIRDHCSLGQADHSVTTFTDHGTTYNPRGKITKVEHRAKDISVIPLPKLKPQGDSKSNLAQKKREELGPNHENFRKMSWKEIVGVGARFPKKPYNRHTAAPRYFNKEGRLISKWMKHDNEKIEGFDSIRDLAIEKHTNNGGQASDETWDPVLLSKCVDHLSRDLNAKDDPTINKKGEYRQRMVMSKAPRGADGQYSSKNIASEDSAEDEPISRALAAKVTGSKCQEGYDAFRKCSEIVATRIVMWYLQKAEAPNAKKNKDPEQQQRASQARNLINRMVERVGDQEMAIFRERQHYTATIAKLAKKVKQLEGENERLRLTQFDLKRQKLIQAQKSNESPETIAAPESPRLDADPCECSQFNGQLLRETLSKSMRESKVQPDASMIQAIEDEIMSTMEFPSSVVEAALTIFLDVLKNTDIRQSPDTEESLALTTEPASAIFRREAETFQDYEGYLELPEETEIDPFLDNFPHPRMLESPFDSFSPQTPMVADGALSPGDDKVNEVMRNTSDIQQSTPLDALSPETTNEEAGLRDEDGNQTALAEAVFDGGHAEA